MRSEPQAAWGGASPSAIIEGGALGSNRGDPTPGAIRILTYDTANDWVQRGSDLAATFAAGDTLRVVARSNGQVEIYKNTTLLGTRDVSAWTYAASGGYIGLWSLNGPNTLFDDFGGGTYAGASGPARADAPQPAAKVLRRPAEQRPVAHPPVAVDLGRVAERVAQAVADICNFYVIVHMGFSPIVHRKRGLLSCLIAVGWWVRIDKGIDIVQVPALG